MRLLDDAATLGPMPAWQRALPYEIFSTAVSTAHTSVGLASAVQTCTIVESLLLLAVFVVLRRLSHDGARNRRRIFAIVLAGACAMACVALNARLAGPDIYAIVAFGLMAQPYDPAGAIMPGPDRVIDAVRGSTLVPSPYGPAWNAFAHVLARSSDALGAQVFAFRAAGAVALLAAGAALTALRRWDAAALVVLNPLLWEFNVAEGHNDVFGIALVLLALAVRRRSTLAAIALVALAGAVKFPFIVVGIAIFAEVPVLRTRLAYAACAAAGAIGLSVAFGGRDYLGALRRTAELYAQRNAPAVDLAHALLGAVAFAAVALLLVRCRHLWGASWSFAALGQVAAPWYFGWGIPYAVLHDRYGPPYLAALPATGYIATLLFDETPLSASVRILLVGSLLALQIAGLRPRPRSDSSSAAPAG
jgi:hypothetical protein